MQETYKNNASASVWWTEANVSPLTSSNKLRITKNNVY